MAETTLRRHDARQARPLLETLVRIHAEVHTEPQFAGNPYFGAERARARLRLGQWQPRYEVVLAELDDQLVGYLCGWALPSYTRWWSPLAGMLDRDVTTETGRRTVFIQEIMVRRPWRGFGVGRLLHDSFLAGRTESRALLCVLPDNALAKSAYLRWGWRQLASTRFGAAEPVFDCLVKPLGQGEYRGFPNVAAG